MSKLHLFILTIIFSTIVAKFGMAQIADPLEYERNLSKYWMYRERLNDYFLTGIGPNAGQSIPASERYLPLIIPGLPGPANALKYGDATIHQSMYIAMLATERKLLADQFQPSDQTLRELFFAIFALYRLDNTAEPYYGPNPPCGGILPSCLNGFFIRDDAIPLSPTQINNLNLNANLPVERHINSISSDYDPGLYPSGYPNFDNKRNNEMSKDQVYWILMALSVVKKSIPDDVFYQGPIGPNNWGIPPNQIIPYYFPDGSFFFKDAVKNLTKNIFRHMRRHNPTGWEWIIDNPLCPYLLEPDWESLQNNWPLNAQVLNGCHVFRGWDSFTLSAPLQKIYKRLTNEELPVVFTNMLLIPNHSYWHYLTAKTMWNVMRDVTIGGEDDKVILLNSIANSWYELNSNQTKKNAQNIYGRVHSHESHFLGNLHSYIFDETSEDFVCELQGSFVTLRQRFTASDCHNIFNYGNGNYGHLWWSSSSALFHEESIGNNSPNFKGDYNGIDYMLWHNIWYLNWNRGTLPFLPPFTNKNELSLYFLPIPMPTPVPYFDYGYNNNQTFEFLSFKDIAILSTILPYSNVSMRAGNSIQFMPGFQTGVGVNFTAEIDPPICQPTNQVYRNDQGNYENYEVENITPETKKQIVGIIAYPNPTKNNITLRLIDGNFLENSNVRIIDVTGKVLKEYVIETTGNEFELLLNIESLSPGLYYVNYKNYNSKFVKL